MNKICIIVTAAAVGIGAFGAELVTVAPDGVNTITTTVDDDGFAICSKSTTLAVHERIGYWTPVQYMPKSGEEVVINDAPFVVVAKHDWVRYTNIVERLQAVAERRWQNEHQTDAGRRSWHGEVVKTEVDTEARVKRTVYADGYTWEEKMQPKRPAVPAAKPAEVRRTELPQKLAAKRRQQAQQAVREVNVRFAPGGKVIGEGK